MEHKYPQLFFKNKQILGLSLKAAHISFKFYTISLLEECQYVNILSSSSYLRHLNTKRNRTQEHSEKPLTAQLLSLVGSRPSTQLYRMGSKKRVDTAHTATTNADKEILLPCHRIPNRERGPPRILRAFKGEIIVIASAAKAA
jgi:hypothetical protein